MEFILSFLRSLAQNNNREWFNDNKKVYQESLELFRGFAAELLAGIVQFDPTLGDLIPKETIFRIYKDVRFSKDKLPYKTHFGCWMTKGGRKSTDAGYYFHLEPGNSFLAAGVHMPPKEQLKLIRQEIVYNPEAYLKVINNPVISKRYERAGKEDMLKKGPAGFPKDFEHLEEIKYKHFVFSKNYKDSEIVEKGFLQNVVVDFQGLLPLVNYLNHAMSFTGND
ncbi:MAG: DUF2461 domain-containing protein [Bacteroidota bacterium]